MRNEKEIKAKLEQIQADMELLEKRKLTYLKDKLKAEEYALKWILSK